MPTAKQPSELKSHIGYQLRCISNAVSHSFAQKLAKYEVTVAEWVILREMYANNESTSPGIIAEFTGLTRGAVSKLIDRLVHKKLVSRSEAKTDRRFQQIKLLPIAKELVPKLAAIADENDHYFFSVLSTIEQENLMKTLLKLTESHKLKTNPIE